MKLGDCWMRWRASDECMFSRHCRTARPGVDSFAVAVCGSRNLRCGDCCHIAATFVIGPLRRVGFAMLLMVAAPCATWMMIPASSMASASGYEISVSLYREANAVTPANRAPDATQISHDTSTITLLAGVVKKLKFPWLVSNTKSSDDGIIRYNEKRFI